MKSDLAVTKLNRLVDKHWGFFSATHHHPEELCYVNIPVYVPRRDSVSAGQDLFVDLSNLYALRFTKTTVRGKGKWVNVPTGLHRLVQFISLPVSDSNTLT